MKVFLDTNVWVSAIVFPGLCSDLILELDAKDHRLLTSTLIRQEVHEVIQRKFPRHQLALERFDSLWACALHVPDRLEPSDDADARLVEAARSAGADAFITGDQRVLGWALPQGMRIMSPRQAWEGLIQRS